MDERTTAPSAAVPGLMWPVHFRLLAQSQNSQVLAAKRWRQWRWPCGAVSCLRLVHCRYTQNPPAHQLWRPWDLRQLLFCLVYRPQKPPCRRGHRTLLCGFKGMAFPPKTDLRTAACLPVLLTWSSETQWACLPSRLFQQLCPRLLPPGSSGGGSHCCLPGWCWRRWSWSWAPSLAPATTGPPSGSQSRLVERKVKVECAR